MKRVSAKKLLGERVVTSDGIELGNVVDLELDFESNRVTWVFVGLHRDVSSRFHIDLPFVSGSKAVALQPSHLKQVLPNVGLRITLEEAVKKAVVSFDTL